MSEKRQARVVALIGSAAFLVLAPGTIAVYLPWTMTRWKMQPPLLGLAPLRIVGAALLALGLIGLLDSFRRFREAGEQMGFGSVFSGPLVRSSYRAEEQQLAATGALRAGAL